MAPDWDAKPASMAQKSARVSEPAHSLSSLASVASTKAA
jgi:hypothetical protein